MYSVGISYFKAWKARGLALDLIRGSVEDSYALLPTVAESLKEKKSWYICLLSVEVF